MGATGSGKSELLRSLVAGMAARHAPDLLTMLLVDFKGGAAFAELGTLPHCAGLVTNLAEDVALVDRVRASLSGELERRQQLLRDAGVESLRAYHELRSGDGARNGRLPALPYLLVVVDEFGELLQAQPDFLDVLLVDLVGDGGAERASARWALYTAEGTVLPRTQSLIAASVADGEILELSRSGAGSAARPARGTGGDA